MARTYEIRIRFADKKSARSQFAAWSAQCDAGRSTIHGDHDRPRLVRLRDRTGPSASARLAKLEDRWDSLQAHDEDHAAFWRTSTQADAHAKRLDALESANADRCHDINGHDARLDALESDILDHRARIGDLEDGEPAPAASPPAAPGSVEEEIEQATELLLSGLVPVWYLTEHEALAHGAKGLTTAEATARQSERFESRLAAKDAADAGEPVRPEPGSVVEPTPEQIEAYLRGSADWSRDEGARRWTHVRGWHLLDPPGAADETVTFIAAAESVTPAEMRARILAAATAEDPDRLAKVAFAANGAVGWERMPHLHDHYRAIAAAVAEANGLENDVLAKGLDDISEERDALQAELAAMRAAKGAK